MRRSHYQTTRTLADCEWTTGYPDAQVARESRLSAAICGALLASAIGLALAAILFFGWSGGFR